MSYNMRRPGRCKACRIVAPLYDGKCAECAISGQLYRYHDRCNLCGAVDGLPHVMRVHEEGEQCISCKMVYERWTLSTENVCWTCTNQQRKMTRGPDYKPVAGLVITTEELKARTQWPVVKEMP